MRTTTSSGSSQQVAAAAAWLTLVTGGEVVDESTTRPWPSDCLSVSLSPLSSSPSLLELALPSWSSDEGEAVASHGDSVSASASASQGLPPAPGPTGFAVITVVVSLTATIGTDFPFPRATSGWPGVVDASLDELASEAGDDGDDGGVDASIGAAPDSDCDCLSVVLVALESPVDQSFSSRSPDSVFSSVGGSADPEAGSVGASEDDFSGAGLLGVGGCSGLSSGKV